MILFKHIISLRHHLQQLKIKNQKIGFVPTMGALHRGHLSLIEQSKMQSDVTVCSIFVNPSQFNDSRDFEKYPRTPERDILMLAQQKTDILFYPEVKDIYPENLQHTHIHYNLGELENILEGYYRPGHFQGVCRVVHQLLKIIEPDTLFLGRKDYQQCLIIKKLVDDFHLPVEIEICTTAREPDGLALSSRNFRLSHAARKKATGIYKALSFIKENIKVKDVSYLKKEAQAIILNHGFDKIDYVEICDASALKPVSNIENGEAVVALVAAFIEDVRLIDNLLLNESLHKLVH